MKGLNDHHARGPGALWLGAPLVLAACVAAEALPQSCGSPERLPAQVRLSRLVRDGVARLARNTRPAIGPSQAAFVLFALDRLAGVPGFCQAVLLGPSEPVRGFSIEFRACPLDPGRASAPTAAP